MPPISKWPMICHLVQTTDSPLSPPPSRLSLEGPKETPLDLFHYHPSSPGEPSIPMKTAGRIMMISSRSSSLVRRVAYSRQHPPHRRHGKELDIIPTVCLIFSLTLGTVVHCSTGRTPSSSLGVCAIWRARKRPRSRAVGDRASGQRFFIRTEPHVIH